MVVAGFVCTARRYAPLVDAEFDGQLRKETTLLGTLTWALNKDTKKCLTVRSNAMELSVAVIGWIF